MAKNGRSRAAGFVHPGKVASPRLPEITHHAFFTKAKLMRRRTTIAVAVAAALAIMVLKSDPVMAQRRGGRLHGPVFIGGYFYDPFFGPYPWWGPGAYPYPYFPVYD